MKPYKYKGYWVKVSNIRWKPYGAYTIHKEGSTISRATNEPEKLIDRLTSEK